MILTMTVKAVGAARDVDPAVRAAKNAAIAASLKKTKDRRVNQTCKVFTLKIQSSKCNARQREALRMVFLEAKWLRNAIVGAESINEYKIGASVIVKTPNGLEERAFAHLGSQMKQSVHAEVQHNLRALAGAKANGRRVGRLQFTSRVVSIDLKQYENTYRFTSKTKGKIQNIPGRLTLRGLHQLDGWEPANAKLLSKPDGYYLAVTAYRNKEDVSDHNQPGTQIGIDMGLETHITLSNRQKVNVTFDEPERLKRLQRKFARQPKGSNNRHKTRRLLEREYQKLGNRKDNAANQLVHQILANDHVVIQDEQIASWKRRDSFVRGGRNIQHSILGRVKTRLVRHERVTVLPKNAATTQTCICGKKTKHLPGVKTYVCSFCSYTEDRDVHAARNMIRLNNLQQIPQELRESTPAETESDWVDTANTVPIQHQSLKQEASKSSASM